MADPVFPTVTVPDPRTAPGLRWAVIGPGGIARTFAASMHAATASRVHAVCSRSLERAKAFAAEYSEGGHEVAAFDSVDECVGSGMCDVVYVAVPHAYHAQIALRAIEAGVPVVVEKPFALNAEQARQVWDAARAREVFVMEAMWSRFLPHYQVVRDAIAQGMIGEVTAITADHGQYFPYDRAHRLYAPELGGGALLDLGVYPLSFAHAVGGPLRIVAAEGILTADGVDDSVSVLARAAGHARGSFAPGGAVLSVSTTLSAVTPTTALVVGREGSIALDSRFYGPVGVSLTHVSGARGQARARFDYATHVPHTIAAGARGHDTGMAYEIAAASRAICDGALEAPEMTWRDTQDVMEAMDAVRARIGVSYPGE